MSEKAKIFIVEDEVKIARFLQMELEHEGFYTATETNGRRALERLMQESYDLVLLDIMLPEMGGLTICRKLREVSQIPIIMLTAKDAIEDKVTGLDTGANDYLTKPFAIQELFARIRTALRRQPVIEGTLLYKKLKMFTDRYEVEIANTKVELTKKEFALLEYLLRNKNHVLTREQILQNVWGYDYMGDTNVIDVYIRYLRSKIEEPFDIKYIQTIRGIGYAIKD